MVFLYTFIDTTIVKIWVIEGGWLLSKGILSDEGWGDKEFNTVWDSV